MEQKRNIESDLPGKAEGAPDPRPAGTGFFYTSGREVAPTHPDHGPMDQLPRREDGGFDA